jgi:3-hydroxyisobutyrate dehydrogenase-like beta-hydroxyacid dehydrogenase
MTFVDAPVLGTKQPAEHGQLTVLASGPDEAKEPCTPIFEPSFALSMARKDVGLVLDAARRAGIEPEVAQAVARMMDRAIERGHGGEDLAATYLGVR